jgi:hypothetical protein
VLVRRAWTIRFERTNEVTRSRALLGVLLALGLATLWACGTPKQQVMKPAPETEIVLLYHSDTKAEIEECG